MKSLIVFLVFLVVNFTPNFAKELKCKPFEVTCKCGVGMSNVSISVQQCSVRDDFTRIKKCKPCNDPFLASDLCKRFKHCKTCVKGVPKCSTCAKGRSGDFCSKEKNPLRDVPITYRIRIPRGKVQPEIIYPYKMRIARQAPAPEKGNGDEMNGEKTNGEKENGEKEKEAEKLEYTEPDEPEYFDDDPKPAEELLYKQKETCDLPTKPLETNEADCTIYSTKVECILRCVYGYTFPDGQKRTIKCENDNGVWVPSGFDECRPFVACDSVVLISPGKIHCVNHLINKKSWCDIKCFAYEDKKASDWKVSHCNLDGTWTPSLPFCAEPDKDIELVTAPSPLLQRLK